VDKRLTQIQIFARLKWSYPPFNWAKLGDINHSVYKPNGDFVGENHMPNQFSAH